jgi:hypothetical protein
VRHDHIMRVLASLGVAFVLAVVGYSYARLRNRGVDVGPVSDGWLAEQRGEPYDHGR